jgi:radical SAM protein (TIGR01212 family)
MEKRYNPLSDFLKRRFCEKVYKVTLNAGFTCPNRDGTRGVGGEGDQGGCIYCEPSTLIPKDYTDSMTITEQLERGIERVRKRYKAEKFIAYFQVNTNTYADIDHLKGLYIEAASHPDVSGLAVSTRPDCVDNPVLDLLKEIKEKKHLWLELGLQTANDRTLRLIKRGHTVEDFRDAFERASERGIDICAHLIIGLPGEEKADIINTIRFISSLPVWGVKFHQLQVVKGTPIEGMYNRGEIKVLRTAKGSQDINGSTAYNSGAYNSGSDHLNNCSPQVLHLEQYASLVVDCLERLHPDVVVHRLSGDTPREFLVAPLWGVNKFIVAERIERLLQKRGTRQGAKFSQDKEV